MECQRQLAAVGLQGSVPQGMQTGTRKLPKQAPENGQEVAELDTNNQ